MKSTFRSPLAKMPNVYFCLGSWWYCPGAAQLGFGSPMWRRDFGKLLAFLGTGRKSRMFTVAGPGPILSPAIAMSRVNSFSYSLNFPLKIVFRFYFVKNGAFPYGFGFI